jgi:hypothetical protein
MINSTLIKCCILYYSDKYNTALKNGKKGDAKDYRKVEQRLQLMNRKSTLSRDDLEYLNCHCKRCGTDVLNADTGGSNPLPPTPNTIQKGYACIDNWLSPLEPSVYSSPLVGEVSIWRYWKNLNTADGVYSFGTLNTDIETAIGAGKKVSLQIAAGNKTPDWVFDIVPNSTFEELQHIATSTSLTQFQQPIFWGATFKNYWKTFITALCANLTPYWDNIISITATGLNRSSAELRIPSQVINNGMWNINSPLQWLGLGYTTQKFMDTFHEFNDHLLSCIPQGKCVILPVVPHTTPNINDGRDALVEVIEFIAATPLRYCVLDTYVTETYHGNMLVDLAKSLGLKVTGEMAEQYFSAAGNNAKYATALQKFIDWGGYPRMEIWEENPQDYATELTIKKPLYS